MDDASDAVPAVRPPWLLRRAAPVVGGCAAAAAAVVLAVGDPSAPGSRFPACQFRAATGLWCPGCGLTRGTHSLLHGDIAAALGQNVFTPLALVAAAIGWWSWTRRAWTGDWLRLPSWAGPRLGWALLSAAIAYGVARNVPVAPFDALAP
ncbi:MAG: DUF2752 domain-containing protein [Ilumatobacteraceae bacterium]